MMLPPEVTQKLGFYVYLYIDPRNGKIFYVGKGVGDRLLAHLSDPQESRKTKIIGELKIKGLAPAIEVLVHQLPDEKTALWIEAAVIDSLGLADLSNEVRGWNSVRFGRQNLSQLLSLYAAPAVDVVDPLVLFRINQLYRHQMSQLELYEATRGVWKVGRRRDGAKYACAVFESVVREVYEIQRWDPANTTPYTTRPLQDVAVPDKWEFIGQIASQQVRSRYINHSIQKYLQSGSRTAFTYVNC